MKEKILVVDDHKLFTSGLAMLLSELETPYEIIQYDSCENIIGEQLNNVRLVILDFYLPGTQFFDNFSCLKNHGITCPVIVISASPSLVDQSEAYKAGVALFISKYSESEELLFCVEAVLSGDSVVVNPSNKEPALRLANQLQLTLRQLEVLLLVGKGYTNKDIAKTLDISIETVKSHLKVIFRKLEVSNRIEAVDFVRKNGLF